MKTMKKILCIALALVLSLSVFILPASAIDNSVTVDLTDTVVGVDANGNKLHRIVAYVDSTHSLYALQLGITYDTAAFYPVNATTLKKLPAPGGNAFDKTSTDIIFNADADVYAEFAADGYYYGDGVNEDYGYAYFASDVAPKYAKMSDGQLGTELKAAGYAGFYWTFATDFGDNYLIPSGGDESGIDSPIRGKVAVCAVYLAEQATAAEGTYTIGVNGTQVQTVSGTYVPTDVVDSISIGSDMVTIPNAGKTYNSVQITIAEESIINPWKDQIRFNANAAGTALESVDYRTLAQISAEDFAATFTDEATAKEMIKEIGFVYATGGTIDKTTAKTQVETGEGSYTKMPVNYISNAGVEGQSGQYVISCLITDADINGTLSALAYVAYDTDGDKVADSYAYYPTVTTSNINDLYTTYYSQWCEKNGITA